MSITDWDGNLKRGVQQVTRTVWSCPGEQRPMGELKLLVKGERQSTGFETGRALSCVEKIKQTWRAV